MDLVSTVRKSGSRGGVNFSWDDVATSAHRENYLGHSLKAPVGRWQQGKDLTWYAKAHDGKTDDSISGETERERHERERKEELRRIKEAEEDAMAKALGLPPPVRDRSGTNAIEIAASPKIGKDCEEPNRSEMRKNPVEEKPEHGWSREKERHRPHHSRRYRSRSRSHERTKRENPRSRSPRRRHDERNPKENSRHGSRNGDQRRRSRDRNRPDYRSKRDDSPTVRDHHHLPGKRGSRRSVSPRDATYRERRHKDNH